jgi:hypothetical protein
VKSCWSTVWGSNINTHTRLEDQVDWWVTPNGCMYSNGSCLRLTFWDFWTNPIWLLVQISISATWFNGSVIMENVYIWNPGGFSFH